MQMLQQQQQSGQNVDMNKVLGMLQGQNGAGAPAMGQQQQQMTMPQGMQVNVNAVKARVGSHDMHAVPVSPSQARFGRRPKSAIARAPRSQAPQARAEQAYGGHTPPQAKIYQARQRTNSGSQVALKSKQRKRGRPKSASATHNTQKHAGQGSRINNALAWAQSNAFSIEMQQRQQQQQAASARAQAAMHSKGVSRTDQMVHELSLQTQEILDSMQHDGHQYSVQNQQPQHRPEMHQSASAPFFPTNQGGNSQIGTRVYQDPTVGGGGQGGNFGLHLTPSGGGGGAPQDGALYGQQHEDLGGYSSAGTGGYSSAGTGRKRKKKRKKRKKKSAGRSVADAHTASSGMKVSKKKVLDPRDAWNQHHVPVYNQAQAQQQSEPQYQPQQRGGWQPPQNKPPLLQMGLPPTLPPSSMTPDAGAVVAAKSPLTPSNTDGDSEGVMDEVNEAARLEFESWLSTRLKCDKGKLNLKFIHEGIAKRQQLVSENSSAATATATSAAPSMSSATTTRPGGAGGPDVGFEFEVEASTGVGDSSQAPPPRASPAPHFGATPTPKDAKNSAAEPKAFVPPPLKRIDRSFLPSFLSSLLPFFTDAYLFFRPSLISIQSSFLFSFMSFFRNISILPEHTQTSFLSEYTLPSFLSMAGYGHDFHFLPSFLLPFFPSFLLSFFPSFLLSFFPSFLLSFLP
jgi:hypothetical protein